MNKECKIIYVEDLEAEYNLKIYRLESGTNDTNYTKRKNIKSS